MTTNLKHPNPDKRVYKKGRDTPSRDRKGAVVAHQTGPLPHVRGSKRSFHTGFPLKGYAFVLTVSALVLTNACRSPGHIAPAPQPPLSMADAVAVVNRNCALITGTLHAVGHVDGTVRQPDGKARSFHLDGVLFFLAPSYVRFDLKALGDRKFLLGSNAEDYWYFDATDHRYHCDRHDAWKDISPTLPIRPDRVADMLGLSALVIREQEDDTSPPVQRVVDDYQQLLFFTGANENRHRIQKEYWLDRSEPRLLRRVLFRDAMGVVELETHLDDYRAISPDGPVLPHIISTRWPENGDRMRFRINRWRLHEEIGPEAIQFATPAECENP